MATTASTAHGGGPRFWFCPQSRWRARGEQGTTANLSRGTRLRTGVAPGGRSAGLTTPKARRGARRRARAPRRSLFNCDLRPRRAGSTAAAGPRASQVRAVLTSPECADQPRWEPQNRGSTAHSAQLGPGRRAAGPRQNFLGPATAFRRLSTRGWGRRPGLSTGWEPGFRRAPQAVHRVSPGPPSRPQPPHVYRGRAACETVGDRRYRRGESGALGDERCT